MFLNSAIIFMPDNSWSRVAIGSTAESQRVPEQNLHESRRRLYKHRWSYNQESTEHLFISIYVGNLETQSESLFVCNPEFSIKPSLKVYMSPIN